MTSLMAVVIGVLALGAELPSGIDLTADPETKRPRTVMASGGHATPESCKKALDALTAYLENQKFKVSASCTKVSGDGPFAKQGQQ